MIKLLYVKRVARDIAFSYYEHPKLEELIFWTTFCTRGSADIINISNLKEALLEQKERAERRRN